MAQTSFYDIVFANRNKEYGAYSIRKVYVRNVLIGFGVSLVVVAALYFYFFVCQSPQDIDDDVFDENMFTSVNYELYDSLLAIEKTRPEPIKNEVKAKAEEPVKVAELSSDIKVVSQAAAAPDSVNSLLTDEPVPEEAVTEMKEDSVPVDFSIIVDSLPKFQGGTDTFRTYLISKIPQPDTASIRIMQGQLLISFVLAQNGRPEQIKLDKLTDSKWGADIINVIRSAPAWQPAYRHGKPVKTYISVPIVFSL